MNPFYTIRSGSACGKKVAPSCHPLFLSPLVPKKVIPLIWPGQIKKIINFFACGKKVDSTTLA
jgi:hypothetical protein